MLETLPSSKQNKRLRVSVPWFFCSQDFGSFWLSENGCSRAACKSHISYPINACLPNRKGKLFLFSFCYLFAYRPLQCRSSCLESRGLDIYFILGGSLRSKPMLTCVSEAFWNGPISLKFMLIESYPFLSLSVRNAPFSQRKTSKFLIAQISKKRYPFRRSAQIGASCWKKTPFS